MKTERAPWGTVDGVGPSSRFAADTVGACNDPDCEWFRSTGSRKAIQSATRRHVAQTGHVAAVSTTNVVIFRRRAD